MHLTPTEFDLLQRLAKTPHVVYGAPPAARGGLGLPRSAHGERTVDSHVRALRRKLGSDVIRTVHGIGYALDTSAREGTPVRPLDFLPSIKLKLGVVIVAAVLVTVIVVLAGERAGWPLVLTGVAAVVARARARPGARARDDAAAARDGRRRARDGDAATTADA